MGKTSKEKDIAKIKFTIWKSNDKKAKWINNNSDYRKIEYVYMNDKKGIVIDFLLGYTEESWQLWAGKLGAINYDVDPYKNLETQDFADAIMKSLDIIVDLIGEVKDDPKKWSQYYLNM